MAEIINLRRARKAQRRTEKEAQAESNRVKHGIAKPMHKLAKAQRIKQEHAVDAHKLEDSD